MPPRAPRPHGCWPQRPGPAFREALVCRDTKEQEMGDAAHARRDWGTEIGRRAKGPAAWEASRVQRRKVPKIGLRRRWCRIVPRSGKRIQHNGPEH